MNRFEQNWQKLVTLARQAPAADEAVMPPGFATRLAALSVAPAPTPWWGGLERLALRGFVAAMACCVAAAAYSYFGRSADFAEVAELDDAVTVVLDLS